MVSALADAVNGNDGFFTAIFAEGRQSAEKIETICQADAL
jgi:hypothetical protein